MVSRRGGSCGQSSILSTYYEARAGSKTSHYRIVFTGNEQIHQDLASSSLPDGASIHQSFGGESSTCNSAKPFLLVLSRTYALILFLVPSTMAGIDVWHTGSTSAGINFHEGDVLLPERTADNCMRSPPSTFMTNEAQGKGPPEF